MCGRYFIDSDEPAMGTMLAALSPETPIHGGEVFPSNMAPVITRHGELTTMLWGFPRFDGKGLIINARSETAAEKPMFRAPMQCGRCLIPASWYLEWEQSGTAKNQARDPNPGAGAVPGRPLPAGARWTASLRNPHPPGLCVHPLYP